MITDWIAFIKNLLVISLRNNRLVHLIYCLITPSQESYDNLAAYVNKARLYSSCTWQVCWLEYILRAELGDSSITIEEGDGLPVDFIISSDNYIDENLVYGIVNRFKLAGKSYSLAFNNIDYNIRWTDPVCEKTNQIDTSVQWSDPVCEKEFIPEIELTVVVQWTDAAFGSLDGLGGSVSMKNTYNQAVDEATITQYSKLVELQLISDYDSEGFKVDLNGIIAYINGYAVAKELRWSESVDMSNPSYDLETGYYTESKTIYVQLQTVEF